MKTSSESEDEEEKSKPSPNLTYKRLFLEERIFLNNSNSKWISLGTKPNINGEFSYAMWLVDSRGFYMSFSSNQVTRLFSLLQDIPMLKNKFNPNRLVKPEKTTPDKDFYIQQSTNNDFLYNIVNNQSENVKSISIAYTTLKRLLYLEPIILKSYQMLNNKMVRSSFSKILNDVRDNNIHPFSEDKREGYEEEFNEYVPSIITQLYMTSLKKMKTQTKTEDYLRTKVLSEIASNFIDFFIEIFKQENRLMNNDQPLLFSV